MDPLGSIGMRQGPYQQVSPLHALTMARMVINIILGSLHGCVQRPNEGTSDHMCFPLLGAAGEW